MTIGRAIVEALIFDFIQSLPKTETHLHIEGAVPWDLLQDTFPLEFETYPDAWASDFRYDSFTQFEDEILIKNLSFTQKKVIQVVRNGFEVALVEGEQRQAWINELDQIEVNMPDFAA